MCLGAWFDRAHEVFREDANLCPPADALSDLPLLDGTTKMLGDTISGYFFCPEVPPFFAPLRFSILSSSYLTPNI
jgi:hypothetical protein